MSHESSSCRQENIGIGQMLILMFHFILGNAVVRVPCSFIHYLFALSLVCSFCWFSCEEAEEGVETLRKRDHCEKRKRNALPIGFFPTYIKNTISIPARTTYSDGRIVRKANEIGSQG